jgi:phosphopantetheine--protein transferase-like protein
MTQSIGIDLVEIERFKNWRNYSDRQLRKLFSVEEISYCRAITKKSAERFAVRFAAKEALFKALAPLTDTLPPLLTLCAACTVIVDAHGVHLHIDWDALKKYFSWAVPLIPVTQCSLSHTNTTASAVVIATISLDSGPKHSMIKEQS